MNRYYIAVHGPKTKNAILDTPHTFYRVDAEDLSKACDMVRLRHKGSRIFVHDKEHAMEKYRYSKWIKLYQF